MKFQIVSDSSCDLSGHFAKENGITLVPFYVSFDSETYMKEGKEIAIPDFYQQMVDNKNVFPKTSMPSVQDYVDAFLAHVKNKMPVLCICLNAQFSGSYQSALNAKNAVVDDYPDAAIEVVDSRLVTVLQGQFVHEAITLRDKDFSLEEAVSKLKEIRDTGHIFFTTKDLKYLEKGGRIGKAASLAGSVLNLKPLIEYHNRELTPAGVCRGRNQSLKKILANFLKYLTDNQIDPDSYRIVTGYGYDYEEYKSFTAQVSDALSQAGHKNIDFEDHFIGATIGVHTGPYPIGIGILKRCV